VHGGERKGWWDNRGGRRKGGEMTQTLYAHMNKRKNKKKETPPPPGVGEDVEKKEPLYTAGGNVN
jgi:hypothetical protein